MLIFNQYLISQLTKFDHSPVGKALLQHQSPVLVHAFKVDHSPFLEVLCCGDGAG